MYHDVQYLVIPKKTEYKISLICRIIQLLNFAGISTMHEAGLLGPGADRVIWIALQNRKLIIKYYEHDI
jgi:hypothetical protein